MGLRGRPRLQPLAYGAGQAGQLGASKLSKASLPPSLPHPALGPATGASRPWALSLSNLEKKHLRVLLSDTCTGDNRLGKSFTFEHKALSYYPHSECLQGLEKEAFSFPRTGL